MRSVQEFVAPAFHSILTASQTLQKERLQARALKIIFATPLAGSGLEKLESRRENLVKNFAQKCVKKDRVKNWFPLNDKIGYSTRNRFLIKRIQMTY